MLGLPDVLKDEALLSRRAELIDEAWFLLERIKHVAPEGADDPWADPATLARAVKLGILDAPHLLGNATACGRTVTRMIEGACRAVDPATGKAMTERQRLKWLGVA